MYERTDSSDTGVSEMNIYVTNAIGAETARLDLFGGNGFLTHTHACVCKCMEHCFDTIVAPFVSMFKLKLSTNV